MKTDNGLSSLGMPFYTIGKELIEHLRQPIIYIFLKEITKTEHEVVYVGQSVNFLRRLGKHFSPWSDRDKKYKDSREYDLIAYIPCEKENLDKLEQYLINKYNPIYNKQHKYKALCKAMNISKSQFMELYGNIEALV